MEIFGVLFVIWCVLVILYIGFKPRIEGILFRQSVIRQNPDNIHLGNMGYHLALGDEEQAGKELHEHLKFKVNEILKNEKRDETTDTR